MNQLARKIFHQLRHIPGQPLTYVQNPKVGTKSIELSLWRKYDYDGAPENPHSVRPGPFLHGRGELTREGMQSLCSSVFFSVVRNPYSRFLSGYLNKVAAEGPWAKFSVRFGLPSDSRPTIHTLLAILQDMDPHEIDRHFRPQHINLMDDLLALDFLGHFEKFDDVASFLGCYGFVLETNKTNATGAEGRISELMDARALGAVRTIYRTDFEVYGYSDDPGHMTAVAKPRPTVGSDRSSLWSHLANELSMMCNLHTDKQIARRGLGTDWG